MNKRIRAFAALALLPALPARAGVQVPLDMHFHHEGRTYSKRADIEPGTDLDLALPLQSDDKSSAVLLKLRASVAEPDAFGRAPLLYQMKLIGAGDVVLLESAAGVFLRPGTYATIVDCGGWTFNLGWKSKDKSGLRTGDDEVVVTAKSARGDQKCKLHVRPGANGKMAAQLVGDDGRPQVFSFKLSPGEQQQFGGTFDVGYELKFPGYSMQGDVALAPRHGQTIKQGQKSAYVWLGQDN